MQWESKCFGHHMKIISVLEIDVVLKMSVLPSYLIFGEEFGECRIPPFRCFFLGDNADGCSSSTANTGKAGKVVRQGGLVTVDRKQQETNRKRTEMKGLHTKQNKPITHSSITTRLKGVGQELLVYQRLKLECETERGSVQDTCAVVTGCQSQFMHYINVKVFLSWVKVKIYLHGLQYFPVKN